MYATAITQITAMTATVNLEKSWTTFWNAVKGQAGPILNVMSVIGVLMIVMALVKWAWDRRRGSGGQSQALWGALLVGTMLSAPAVIIPMFLLIADVIVNAVISLWKSTAK